MAKRFSTKQTATIAGKVALTALCLVMPGGLVLLGAYLLTRIHKSNKERKQV